MLRFIRLSASGLLIAAASIAAQEQSGRRGRRASRSSPRPTMPSGRPLATVRCRPTANGSRTIFAAATVSGELHYRAVGARQRARPFRSATAPQFTSNAAGCSTRSRQTPAGGRAERRGRRWTRRSRRRRGRRRDALRSRQQSRASSIFAPARPSTFDDVQSYSPRATTDRTSRFARYGTPGRRSADVIVRDLDAGTELTFGNVAEFAWSDDGSLLAMTIDVDGEDRQRRATARRPQTGAIRSLDASAQQYTGSGLALDRATISP